jgi:hypothetical protein
MLRTHLSFAIFHEMKYTTQLLPLAIRVPSFFAPPLDKLLPVAECYP